MFLKFKFLVVLSLFLTGCVTTGAGPQGILFTSTTVAGSANKVGGTKTVKSCSKSFFGLVAFGGDSIEEAATKVGISNVNSISYESFSILGFYSSLCAVITGD